MRHLFGKNLQGKALTHQECTGFRVLSFLFLALLAVSCSSTPQDSQDAPNGSKRPPVELTAEVSRAEAGISDPITFRVTLDAEPDIQVSLPEIGSRIKGFRILDFGTEGPKSREGRIWTQAWFKLQADIVGSYVLPSIALTYKNADGKDQEVKTPQVFVEIKSALNPEGGEKDIRDIKAIEKTKREIPLYEILLAAGGLLLAGVVVVVLFLRKRKKAAEAMRLPPEDLARRELRDLESTGILDEGRYREYVFSLSMIFRRYLERRYGISAVEQTTEEILTNLRRGSTLAEEGKKEVRGFLEETDPIKYRGLEPQGEYTDGLRARLLSFLGRTQASVMGEGILPGDAKPSSEPRAQT